MCVARSPTPSPIESLPPSQLPDDTSERLATSLDAGLGDPRGFSGSDQPQKAYRRYSRLSVR